MNASEAKKLSADNQVTYDSWLKQALEKIEKAAKNGDYEAYVYVGSGNYHNDSFKNELLEKESLIKKLGYKIKLDTRSGWESIFYGTFKYYLEVKWD